MGTNIATIHTGALDYQVLDQGLTTQLDLGSSHGGGTFTYTPAYYEQEIDQALAPVGAQRIKEDLMYETTLPQAQASLFLAAMSYPGSGITTVAAGTLAAMAAPTVAVVGTAGAQTVSYEAVAFGDSGDAVPSTVGTTSTANATLNNTNYNNVTYAAPGAGARGVKILRTVGGASQGLIATIYGTTGGVLADTGLIASAYTAAIVAPATPTQDSATIGGLVTVPIRTLDLAHPHNDGTANHTLYHVWRCYSADPFAYGFDRSKNGEYKIKLKGLADTSVSPARLWSIVDEHV